MLKGLGGADALRGGKGADDLLGGTGADDFVFTTLGDSTAKAAGRDTIGDFSHGQNDDIMLSAIDANTRKGGNQGFHFIGDGGFGKTAGELRLSHSRGDAIVQGDVNGDGKADFAITVEDVGKLVAGDFQL